MMFKHIKGDFFGGITAGIVALPLALAFGVSSGLGPSAGLYGAIFIGFFAALLGGTNTQISGPTAPMTAVSVVVIGTIIAENEGSIQKALPLIMAVFFLAGLIQILLGVIGIGKYIRYIPYPVVSGFMTAIGVMILIGQVFPAIGYYPKEDIPLVESFKPEAEANLLKTILDEEAGEDILVLEDFVETITRSESITGEQVYHEAENMAKKNTSGAFNIVKHFPKVIDKVNYLELILTLATIFVIYGFKRITTAIPSTLVALLLVSAVAYFAGFEYRPIQEIPSGFPSPNLEMFSKFTPLALQPYVFAAISLAFLGAIDSLLTSVVADNMTKTKHNPNKELIGQGIGNGIASLFGGIPGAGATIRTVVNINAGGKTRISGMIAGILLLIVLLALGPVASKIPAAVLAGILVTVGIGVMDYKGLKAIPNMPKDIDLKLFKISSEVLIMIVVLILSVFWNLINAVGIGLVISCIVFMKKMGDFTADQSNIKSLQEAEDLWSDEKDFPVKLKEEVYIKHLDGPLFFGYTSEFTALAEQIPSTASHVILRMDKVPYVDQSGLYALEDVLLDLESKNIQTLIVSVQKQPLMMMENIDLVPDLIPKERMFADFSDCLSYIEQNVKDVY